MIVGWSRKTQGMVSESPRLVGNWKERLWAYLRRYQMVAFRLGPHVLFLILHVHILCLLCLSCCYYFMFLFFFVPLDSLLLVGLAPFYSHPQQCVLSTHNYQQISCFIPLQPLFHDTCSTNYFSLIPWFTHLQHSLHNTVLSYSHTYTSLHTIPRPYLPHNPLKKTSTALGSKYP